ncbi:FHA domain-containing protein, partial [Nocardioides sp.]|uniref:FHA domain-containing protein n=1 Tax=Nocardioides sp. TaxID=35761 RepID=UPI00262BAD95
PAPPAPPAPPVSPPSPVAPPSPGVPTAAARPAPTIPAPAVPVDELTRRSDVVPTPPPALTGGWALRSTTGVLVEVAGETLLGRDPDPTLRPGAAIAPLSDPEFTVSKTHAAVGLHGSTLWLEDLDSTHGVVVRRQGDEMRIEPRSQTRLLVGDTVVLGAFALSVEAR